MSIMRYYRMRQLQEIASQNQDAHFEKRTVEIKNCCTTTTTKRASKVIANQRDSETTKQIAFSVFFNIS